MTSNLFPTITPEADYLRLAGYLKYEPWVKFDNTLMRSLQYILDETLNIDGCENPDVIADWREVVRQNGGVITHRSNIILYRDGGDWAEENNGHFDGIGVLFCRQDINQTTDPNTINYRVHIPKTEWQDKLLILTSQNIFESLKQGNPDQLNAIRAYLESIINDQKQWIPLKDLLGNLTLEDFEDDNNN